jgi:L-threonylcarbamoyladenylate synthase
MSARIIKIRPDNLQSSHIREAVQCLQSGGVIAYPTETVYGLGCDIACASAVHRIQGIKERDTDKPFLILVETIEDAVQLVEGDIAQSVLQLMNQFWPGPMTLIFSASSRVPFWIRGPGSTVGIRISPFPVCQSLLHDFQKPLVSTSANPRGVKPAKSIEEVVAYFGDSVDLILDGGVMESSTPSTVVDVTGTVPVIKRKGVIPVDSFRRIIGYLQESESV